MKVHLLFILFCGPLLALSQNNFSMAQFTMSVKGTSNLHDWESSVKEVRGRGSMATDATGLPSIKSLTVDVPVKSIKSTKGQIMDNKTYEAFNSNSNPNITYRLERINSVKKVGSGYEVNATGSLTMAGKSNRVDLTVKGNAGSDGSLTFQGTKKLKMTDFGMKPPTALFGTLTTGDEVEVVFYVKLKREDM